jgi:hypothetical protein
MHKYETYNVVVPEEVTPAIRAVNLGLIEAIDGRHDHFSFCARDDDTKLVVDSAILVNSLGSGFKDVARRLANIAGLKRGFLRWKQRFGFFLLGRNGKDCVIRIALEWNEDAVMCQVFVPWGEAEVENYP